MSVDKSLKLKSMLARHRNVLSRAERIDKLSEVNVWEEGRSPLGLPKVSHRKPKVGKKEKTPKEAAAGAEAAPAAGDKAAAAAAPAKGAAKPAAKPAEKGKG